MTKYDFLMHLLDSRASRMTPSQALLTVHADYIGGANANYRKWYFAAQLNLDDAVGHSQNPGLNRLKSVKQITKTPGSKSLDSALNRWRNAMNNMSHYDRLRQIALYLLLWGEAGNVRFVPECLCFIFKCADDYYRSPECQNRIEPVKEGLYLEAVIKPIYRFMRDQGYEVIDGKFVRKEKDHADIIGYDDINQLFWYPEGLAKIILRGGVCFLLSCISYDFFLNYIVATPRRHPSSSTLPPPKPCRMGQGFLQNLLRNTFLLAHASQFQPYLDHSCRHILVLHSFQFPSSLCASTQEISLGTYDLVRSRTRRSGVNRNHAPRYNSRVLVHPHHVE